MQRTDNRKTNELRPISFDTRFNIHAEGSVLAHCGDTLVICTASVEKTIPHFLRGTKRGWITAEYSMLPRSTEVRNKRESSRGKQSGRTLEIQRLIGRSLRSAVDMRKLEGLTITIDCDVIQADGGTRTTAITAGYIALYQALKSCGKLDSLHTQIAATSVGIVNNTALLDLDYSEDSHAQTDMNLVMTDTGAIVEIQGTAEKEPFTSEQMTTMFALAESGIQQIISLQKAVLD